MSINAHDRDDLLELLTHLVEHGVVADDHERHSRQLRLFGLADGEAVNVVAAQASMPETCDSTPGTF